MTRRARETVAADIYEPALPAGISVVHLTVWYGVRDLWLYRDTGGRVRTLTPVRGLPSPLPDGELRGWPPIGPWLAAQGV